MTAVVTNETRAIASLTPDPKNARRHSEAQIAQIVNSIEEFSYVAPVIIQPSGQLIGGHATVEALKRLGREQADVRVVAGLTPAAYRKLALALNRLPENSSWDDAILRDVMAEIKADGEDLDGIGFSPNEIDKLLKPADDIAVTEIETGPVEDEFWISVRGPLAQQANAMQALQAALKPFDGVTVDQGTIALG